MDGILQSPPTCSCAGYLYARVDRDHKRGVTRGRRTWSRPVSLEFRPGPEWRTRRRCMLFLHQMRRRVHVNDLCMVCERAFDVKRWVGQKRPTTAFYPALRRRSLSIQITMQVMVDNAPTQRVGHASIAPPPHGRTKQFKRLKCPMIVTTTSSRACTSQESL